MKKRLSTKILSVFLSLLMVISVLPTGAITAHAAQNGVERKLAEVVKLFPNNSYFSVNGRACPKNHGNACYNCYYPNVVNQRLKYGWKNTYGSWSCYGFSCFVTRYIFGTEWPKASYVVGSASVSNATACNNLLNKAKVGDIVSFGTRHRTIYLGKTNSGVIVYDANQGDKYGLCNQVKYYHTFSYANLKRYYGNINIELRRMNNYDSVAGKTEPVQPSKPAVPDKPAITGISATDIAKGKSVTITWNASSRATSYNVAIRGAETRNIALNGSARSCSFTLNNLGTHSIYVEAKNSTGTSLNNNCKVVVTHNPVNVKFVDWDETELGYKGGQSVNYGESAIAPAPPERKGYTFQGWNGIYQNVKSDQTVKATYKINTYIVNFRDKDGKILKSEKVEYGKDATAPTDTNTPKGYEFLGWDSEDYKNVYTDASNKTININGIYQWKNKDLPVICEITSAKRQSDGYYVYFDLTNYPNSVTRGRAVVSLKTKTGKLVDASESAAFSIPKDGTKKAMEVFIPCEYAATSAEVIIVDSYSSGVPISEKVTSAIDQGLMWSQWSTDKPDESDSGIISESRIEYRSRNKENSTGNTKTKNGWIYDGTYSTKVGSWSGWSWNSVSAFTNESTKREVRTQSAIKSYNQKTVWNYYRYAVNRSGGRSSASYSTSFPNKYTYQFDSALAQYGTTSQGVMGYKWWYSSSNYVVLYANSPSTSKVNTTPNYATQYSYRDTNYTYNFYRWSDWTDWNVDETSATDNRQVETRTVYRYKNNDAGTENETGKEYTVSNKLDPSFAGKQITLFVYGYTGASDYTNQYIGQTTVAKDGSYSFTFKLRQEPTVETGDYTIAIGIEGTTNLIAIDKIEAPKPKYTVNFYDWDGTIISTQTVTQGDDAVVPTNPTRKGYNFVGWDKSVANIKENTDFYADFEKQQFTVVFVDWKNESVKVQKFAYGDVLTPPEAEEVEGKTFDGWDEIRKGNTIVKSDMVVRAEYETNTYTVKFYDFDGNVISTQQVEYGKSPEVPDTVKDSLDGKKFAGWFNPEDYSEVKTDVAVYPTYYFDETSEIPTANYESGEYTNALKLTLSSSDENAVIYYYFGDDASNEKIYTEPITIDKTSSVSFYATSLGKNDSNIATNYYCINTFDKTSDWMLRSELPDEVLSNSDLYNLESETGYRFKDLKSVSAVEEQNNLEKDGWSKIDETYTDYTSWQDNKIEVESSLIGFEIDTRETEDPNVTRYQYSHYKYTDSEGNVVYSPTRVDNYNCEYETVISDTRLSIAGFLDDNTTYYNYNDQRWFTQTKVNGVKTQYRSRYKNVNYYKWTSWTVDAPSSTETRETQSETLYRYSNKNHHIIYLQGMTKNSSNDYGVYYVEDSKSFDVSQLEMVGYDFEGLYKDEKLTEKFDASTPITQSMTLYANFTPKTYTVTFQMQDGTEIDSQRVSYMEGATAPATDAVPGFVFGGWDKDFSSITEDTVVTGKYFKESEYTRVSLDKNTATLYTGTQLKLNAKVTPTEYASEEVEWSSSDPSVASVDDEGNVIANSAGAAEITVKVVKTKETAICKITVKNDLLTIIVLADGSKLDYDSKGFIRKVKANTKACDVVNEFANKDLSFVNINSQTLGDNDYIGTGTSVVLKNGNTTVSKQFVVTGDVTGDGVINNRDVATMNKYLVSKVDLENYQVASIDVNGDGYVNNKDAAMVARYLVGKEAL